MQNPPTPVYIRAAYSPFMVVLALVMGTLLVIVPPVFAIWMLSQQVSSSTVSMAVLCLAMAIFFAAMMHNNFQWVELDGELIRGRRIVTRLLVEQRIENLVKVTT